MLISCSVSVTLIPLLQRYGGGRLSLACQRGGGGGRDENPTQQNDSIFPVRELNLNFLHVKFKRGGYKSCTKFRTLFLVIQKENI